MYIRLEGPEKNLTLRIPAAIALNFVTANLLSGKSGMSPSQIREIFRILKKYRKTHPDWTFLEMWSKDGEHVVIKL